MKKILIGFVIALCLFLVFTPYGVKILNIWGFSMQKAEDISSYKVLKEVENTCRVMISSYKSDKLVYDQFKDSTDSEKTSWAEQAKMRANKTAISYNEYILKNNFVWKDAVPNDIAMTLEIIN